MSSNGFILTVSFQPNSSGHGTLMAPSHPTLFTTCTLNRWKWIAWVSTPLWVIFQSWVAPSGITSVAGSANPYGIVVWMVEVEKGNSTPSVAFIRPSGSNSSWIVFGSNGVEVPLTVNEVSEIRATLTPGTVPSGTIGPGCVAAKAAATGASSVVGSNAVPLAAPPTRICMIVRVLGP